MAMLESRDSPCGNVSMGIYTSGSGTLVSWKLGTQAVGSAVHSLCSPQDDQSSV